MIGYWLWPDLLRPCQYEIWYAFDDVVDTYNSDARSCEWHEAVRPLQRTGDGLEVLMNAISFLELWQKQFGFG